MELGRNLESDGIFPVNKRFREGGACTTRACYARVNVGSSYVLLIRDQPESDTWKGSVSDDTWPNPLLPRGTNVLHHNRRPFPAIGAVSDDGYRRPTVFPAPTKFFGVDIFSGHRPNFPAHFPATVQFFQRFFPTAYGGFPATYGGFPAKKKKE